MNKSIHKMMKKDYFLKTLLYNTKETNDLNNTMIKFNIFSFLFPVVDNKFNKNMKKVPVVKTHLIPIKPYVKSITRFNKQQLCHFICNLRNSSGRRVITTKEYADIGYYNTARKILQQNLKVFSDNNFLIDYRLFKYYFNTLHTPLPKGVIINKPFYMSVDDNKTLKKQSKLIQNKLKEDGDYEDISSNVKCVIDIIKGGLLYITISYIDFITKDILYVKQCKIKKTDLYKTDYMWCHNYSTKIPIFKDNIKIDLYDY